MITDKLSCLGFPLPILRPMISDLSLRENAFSYRRENLGIEVALYLKDMGFSAIFAADVGAQRTQ